MIYLRKFDNHAAYEAAESGLILPNVSLCVQENEVHYNPLSPTPPTPSHDYVEIGGIKWATMNVGANSITDYGNYYQYGKGAATYQETSGDTDYEGTENPLAASVDTVVQEWGGNWRMPTQAEFESLFNNTNAYEETDYEGSGINGYLFIDTEDESKTIFLPFAGIYQDGSLINEGYGLYYWTATPYDDSNAMGTYYYDGLSVTDWQRSYGLSIRPVLDE